ncbi:hypothetical protein QCN29_14875 [Streptomyces sp. HNM0663]|uniref:Uncharacterized protein n=1 Tax=Streptomyces chengmaiensis TaxID=3040919 RepID=A0ABT6HN03_9ACTN|nr:hypothetical protein [Streptomyces chengmaiensis]MDH2390051.1 hypothetical protein [Streptomyces chengmaiensis]
MSTSTISTNDLANLQAGDKVVVKSLDENTEESICTTAVLDRRDVPAIPGWGGREEKTLVRLGNGSWYDLATGLQDDSGATRIERVA